MYHVNVNSVDVNYVNAPPPLPRLRNAWARDNRSRGAWRGTLQPLLVHQGFFFMYPAPPLYKLRPCPSYSSRGDRNILVCNLITYEM